MLPVSLPHTTLENSSRPTAGSTAERGSSIRYVSACPQTDNRQACVSFARVLAGQRHDQMPKEKAASAGGRPFRGAGDQQRAVPPELLPTVPGMCNRKQRLSASIAPEAVTVLQVCADKMHSITFRENQKRKSNTRSQAKNNYAAGRERRARERATELSSRGGGRRNKALCGGGVIPQLERK